MPESHCFLADCARHCSSRAAPLRFHDSLTLKELCRTRSLCGDAQHRRALSLSIHVCRKEEKRLWKKTLLDHASRENWCARRLLHGKTNASTAWVGNSLVQHFGSREAAVTHVKDYFVHKFASPSERSMCFDGLPCAEPDFTQQGCARPSSKWRREKLQGCPISVSNCSVVWSGFACFHLHAQRVSSGSFDLQCGTCCRPGYFAA